MKRLLAAIFLLVLTLQVMQALYSAVKSLESLAYVARMGCDVVEIDVGRLMEAKANSAGD